MALMESVRRRWWAWALMGLVVVVALVLGAHERVETGTSADRLYALSGDMKCLQCAGESVANSQAPIAVEMRSEIKRQMADGKTDDEILTYFVDRYGQRVLLRPSGSGISSLVWIIPVVVVAAAACGLVFVFSKWRSERGVLEVTDADRDLVAKARGGGST